MDGRKAYFVSTDYDFVEWDFENEQEKVLMNKVIRTTGIPGSPNFLEVSGAFFCKTEPPRRS